MKSFSTIMFSAALASEAYAVTGNCNAAQRADIDGAGTSCDYTNECTTDDATGTVVIDCGNNRKECDTAYDCAEETGYCDGSRCAYCTANTNCIGTNA